MCGRYGMVDQESLKERFELINADDLGFYEDYNIAPGSINPVITQNSPKQVKKMRWGLVPNWWKKDPKLIQFKTINARSEEIEQKPMYRHAFHKQRCIVPASYFFEWALTDEPKVKEPFLFKLKGEKLMSLAGIFDIWNDAEGKEFPGYSILTTAANSVVEKIHNRMPVILDRKTEEHWINNSEFDLAKLKRLCEPYPARLMELYHVSRAMGNSRLNGPEVIKETKLEVKTKPSRPAWDI